MFELYQVDLDTTMDYGLEWGAIAGTRRHKLAQIRTPSAIAETIHRKRFDRWHEEP